MLFFKALLTTFSIWTRQYTVFIVHYYLIRLHKTNAWLYGGNEADRL